VKEFTLSRSDVSINSRSTLMAQLVSATGSQAESEGIVRSLDRLGTDPTILRYRLTLEARASRMGGTSTRSWRVSADRGHKPTEGA
jgi:uncharacterized protein involved in type VI secretion and phage assembly